MKNDTPTLAQRLIDEYSTGNLLIIYFPFFKKKGKNGYLTKDEFMVLADLILSNYQYINVKILNNYVIF